MRDKKPHVDATIIERFIHFEINSGRIFHFTAKMFTSSLGALLRAPAAANRTRIGGILRELLASTSNKNYGECVSL
jgi:hypothetical protein